MCGTLPCLTLTSPSVVSCPVRGYESLLYLSQSSPWLFPLFLLCFKMFRTSFGPLSVRTFSTPLLQKFSSPTIVVVYKVQSTFLRRYPTVSPTVFTEVVNPKSSTTPVLSLTPLLFQLPYFCRSPQTVTVPPPSLTSRLSTGQPRPRTSRSSHSPTCPTVTGRLPVLPSPSRQTPRNLYSFNSF